MAKNVKSWKNEIFRMIEQKTGKPGGQNCQNENRD